REPDGAPAQSRPAPPGRRRLGVTRPPCVFACGTAPWRRSRHSRLVTFGGGTGSPGGEGPGCGGVGKSGTPSRRGCRSRSRGDPMSTMNRRDVVRLLTVAPLATAFRWAPESVSRAAALARGALDRGAPYEPKFFTAHEWDTVRVVVDLIIPKD